ncbi:AAA family ATPase [Streptosporangium sp. NPDC000239]|uniref:AAA family ATPase n=1 Tax=Streptosporangium sp. NPDC000239 TaxID=3154248 RepID=UPI00331AFA21
MTLSIPLITPDHDTIKAALAYAAAGWYVLPVNRATKHAGSVLGKGWPSKSSRDPQTIAVWFAGTDHALALHVGRSGAIAFDVDRPDALPPLLRAALLTAPGPFQSTREHDAERGHYLYAAPDGRTLGNSTGGLGKAWGEVRGKNGIIVVSPSIHEKADQGGRYEWVRTGALPELPPALAGELPDAGDSNDAATDREVKAFLDRHTAGTRPELLAGLTTQFQSALATGESRHGIALRAAAGAMREAAAGLYPALDAAAALSGVFITAMATSRDGTERILTARQAQTEFLGVLSWAVAQVAVADLAAVRADVDERLPHDDDFSDLIAPTGPGAQGPPPFATDGALATVHQLHPTPDPTPPAAAVDGAEELDLEALAYEREVAHELRKIRVREEAARRAKKARAGNVVPPDITLLSDFLAVEDEPVRYRVDGLWPVGGRVMLAAQFKAGKTTTVGNLVRALADGVPFLGKFDVTPPSGRIVIIDNELDARMLRSWLRDQGITRTDAVGILPLRGRLSSFDILDPQTRTEWADRLRALGATVVVLDCLAPVLDALGLSEDKEAGRLLVAIDELLKEAGVEEAIVIHHMGHSGERSRGASRLRDWPDVEWRLVREKDDSGETNPAAPRYFSAYGRDVDVPESLLSFNPAQRRLELAGGSRKDAKTESAAGAIVEWLTLSPHASGRAIEEALADEHPQKAIRDALKSLIRAGKVVVVDGPRRAKLHSVSSECVSASSASPVRQRTSSECVSASIGDALHSLHADPRDPSDLITHSQPSEVIVDGLRIDPTTGEILNPEDAP